MNVICMQGRYTDAMSVLNAVRQQDASVVKVSWQKGGPVPVVTTFYIYQLTIAINVLMSCLALHVCPLQILHSA